MENVTALQEEACFEAPNTDLAADIVLISPSLCRLK